MNSFRMTFPLLLQIATASVLFSDSAFAQSTPAPNSLVYLPPTRETYLKFAKETDAALDRDLLAVWFPRALDNDHGGFRSNFSREWKPLGKESKFSVFQGRMTWISSQIVQRRPTLRQQYLPYVTHGVDYLHRDHVGQGKRRVLLGLVRDRGNLSVLH